MQVDGSLGRRYEGTGLGLPLAQRLAELHGGTLRVDSVKGEGTIVTVTMPPERTVAIDPLFGYAKRRTLMTTPVTLASVRDAAHALLASDGVPVSVIKDSPGFVAQRVVAHIVNVGCDIVQMRIASPKESGSRPPRLWWSQFE